MTKPTIKIFNHPFYLGFIGTSKAHVHTRVCLSGMSLYPLHFFYFLVLREIAFESNTTAAQEGEGHLGVSPRYV